MKRELIKKILHIIVTVITSVITTLGTTSCVVNLEPQTPPPQLSADVVDESPVRPVMPVMPRSYRDYFE